MKKTQTDKIRGHLEKYKKITSWEAITLYKITRLAAVIYILRNDHEMKINSDWGSNEEKNWVEYILVE